MNYALGIDIGGTFIKYALVDAMGNILYQDKRPTVASREALMEQLALIVSQTTGIAAARGLELTGIGIGTPGVVDRAGRTVLGGAPNIRDWNNVAVADYLEERCGIPVRLCNDANALGLAEQMYGAARGLSDVVFISVGTGIGGAVIIDGRMFRGFDNRGGELGCIPLIADGIECGCGARGCLEAYASTAAMLRFYAERSSENIDGRQLVERFLAGEALAGEIIRQECCYLGRGIAGLINIFAPQMVVIGGGLSEAGDFFIEMVSEAALGNAIPDCGVNTRICAARLGNDAGVIGAAGLVLGN